MIMVHAITEYGTLVTRDMDRFPIAGGPLKPKANVRGRKGPRNPCEVRTAEFVWRAKDAKG